MASIRGEAPPPRAESAMSHWTNTLMVVTGDVSATVLELVLGLVPDAVFDPEALLAVGICPRISNKNIQKSEM
jgi:hypothetical protein